METETHLIDRDNHQYLTKVDLFKHSEQIVGFKVMCYDRVVECHLDKENKPISSVRRFVDDDRPHILKEGFSNVGKLWSDEEIEDLKQLFVSEDGNLVKISEKMERTQQGIRLRLRSMGLIDEEDVNWLDKLQRKDFPNETKEE